MKNTINKILFSFFPILAFYIFSLHDLFNNMVIDSIGCILTLPYLIRYLIIKENKSLIIGMLFFFVLGSIINLFATKNNIGGTFVLIGTISLALYCLDNIDIMSKHVIIIIIYISLFIFQNLILHGIDANELYHSYSRNHPGFLLVLWVSFYCFIKISQNKKCNILIPAIALYLSFFLSGRSSLGMLCLLFAIILLTYSNNFKYKIIINTIFLIFIVLGKNLITNIYEMTTFYDESLDSSRYRIWSEYFSHLTFESIIAGLDTYSVPFIAMYKGNPHNAFINLHARLGLFAFIYFISLLFRSFHAYYQKKQFLLAIFLLILLTRLFFDSECFIGTYDFVVYTMILYPLYKKPKYNKITI